MPFTLSHAAAVLPVVRGDGSGRGRLVPAVLVAGSFSPDMTYFAASAVPGAMDFGGFTHSFAGVFTVDVVVAWVLVGLWLLVREPLVALLPRGLQARPAVLLRCGVPRSRVAAGVAVRWYASAALGALTHVVWDAFTHADRWGMRWFPVLGTEIAGSPLYWYLQYGGSVLAAVVIGVWGVRALRRVRVDVLGPAGSSVPVLAGRDRWWAWGVIAGCAVAAGARRATVWWGEWGARARPWELIPTLCFGVGAGLVLGVLLYAIGVRVWRPVRGADGGPEPVSVVGVGRGGAEGGR
ncbi:DUF4184 family protein [Streptomyces sp. NPDC002766]|uniref:DUF4184 family protein n=1 Tax=Streptomyces sp. NPDC002766 TaxID=3154429 RepID=UPI003323BC54